MTATEIESVGGWVAGILLCPACQHRALSRSGDIAKCGNCGNEVPWDREGVHFHADSTSSEWASMQAESIARYQDESYLEDVTEARIFGGFIAATVDRRLPVLDIGCGITRELPPYVKELSLPYYVGLEPISVGVQRNYDCLVGAVCEAIPLESASVGAAVFATSLDHIDNVDAAIAEVRRVLTPDGKLYFWIGMYEPEALAYSKTFEHALLRGSRLKRTVRAAIPYLETGYLLYRMNKRRRDLAAGRRLDNAHCRYYTRDLVARSMETWGLRINRQLLVPGSTALLVEAQAA
jgi:SAM-dependent methyltransferase